MFLTVTSTAPDATDLGFLLAKHPDRVQQFELPFGRGHVFYPEATAERCTVAVLVEVDAIELARGRRFRGDRATLGAYVNDRPYAASSMLAVTLGRLFNTAMKGTCAARPELVGVPLPLEVHVPAVSTAQGPALVERLFAPLGWHVDAAPGGPRHVDLTLRGSFTVREALNHLYVLLPVLDGSKHYWTTDEEEEKLERAGAGWLDEHPERAFIARRYIGRRPAPDPGAPPLAAQRRDALVAWLGELGASRVVDLGCGEGVLLAALLGDPRFSEVVGIDPSPRELARAERRLRPERLPDQVRARLRLRQSSATLLDPELAGFDAIVLSEVIEHVDLDRLPSLERAVFGSARPAHVLVTTPNAEFNVHYDLADGQRRHPDHRFEWERATFGAWAGRTASENGYSVELRGVGDADPRLGTPTQAAIFTRTDTP